MTSRFEAVGRHQCQFWSSWAKFRVWRHLWLLPRAEMLYIRKILPLLKNIRLCQSAYGRLRKRYNRRCLYHYLWYERYRSSCLGVRINEKVAQAGRNDQGCRCGFPCCVEPVQSATSLVYASAGRAGAADEGRSLASCDGERVFSLRPRVSEHGLPQSITLNLVVLPGRGEKKRSRSGLWLCAAIRKWAHQLGPRGETAVFMISSSEMVTESGCAKTV